MASRGLIGSLSGQISLVQSREAAVQTQLAQDQAALASSQAALAREEQLLAILRARLDRAQTRLARQLVSSYESDNPDLVTVVLESNGFNDLLSKITYLRDAEHQQQSIITVTRDAKRQADAAALRLAKLEATERQITADAAIHARELAGMNSLLQSKRSALRQAQAVQQAALSATKSHASQLQAEISRIEAQQAAQQAAQRAAAAVELRDAIRVLRPRARTIGRLGDPLRDRPVRVGRPEPPAQQRRRQRLLPDPPVYVEGSGGQRSRRVPRQQGRTGRGRQPALERRRRSVQLGLRGDRRDPLTAGRRAESFSAVVFPACQPSESDRWSPSTSTC